MLLLTPCRYMLSVPGPCHALYCVAVRASRIAHLPHSVLCVAQPQAMGNTVPSERKGAGLQQPDLHVYLQEFPQMVFSSVMKQGKFIKTASCKSGEQGQCVIKVCRPRHPRGFAAVPSHVLRVCVHCLIVPAASTGLRR